MLAHHCKTVCLSLISTNLPVSSVVEAAATLYQKDVDHFHLLMTEPLLQNQQSRENSDTVASPQLLWLNICPYRVALTKQGKGRVNYRHFWDQGVYGFSRYWLRDQSLQGSEQMYLRNFTCSLTLTGRPLPEHLRLEYELWAEKLQLGCYILNLEIHH